MGDNIYQEVNELPFKLCTVQEAVSYGPSGVRDTATAYHKY